MKYSVGDLVLLKKYDYKPRPKPLNARPLPNSRRLLPLDLENTFGIITTAENHNDIYQGFSSENDNCYTWFSQVNGKEYYFYQDEVTGEVIL